MRGGWVRIIEAMKEPSIVEKYMDDALNLAPVVTAFSLERRLSWQVKLTGLKIGKTVVIWCENCRAVKPAHGA